MSLATIVPTSVGGVQAAVSSAAIVKNILAGLVPSLSGLDAITTLARDIGGFQFDYIGEERLQAGVEITDHWTETNQFMQDHRAVKPTFITMRGFVSEQTVNRFSVAASITALAGALTPLTPYIGTYSPGASAAMQAAVNQTDQIINQLTAISNAGKSITKLVGGLAPTKVQLAYDKLDALRNSGAAFAVVTPWATFGDIGNGHGPMMIDELSMTAPEETRTWADIVVRLKEIRVAPSLLVATFDNARGGQAETFNGTIGATA